MADGQLKLHAIRGGGLTGFAHMALESLKTVPTRTAEMEWQYQNLLLWQMSNDVLLEHLRARTSDLDEIASLMDSGDTEAATIKARSMFFAYVGRAPDRSIDIGIAGMASIGVGVLRALDVAPQPSLTLDGYVYVEQIDRPWYLYRRM